MVDNDDLHQNISNHVQKLVPMSCNTWTHCDKQVVKALFAGSTSVRFATQIQGIKSRQGTTFAKCDEGVRTSEII